MPVISHNRELDQPSVLKCDCPLRELNDVKRSAVNAVGKGRDQ